MSTFSYIFEAERNFFFSRNTWFRIEIALQEDDRTNWTEIIGLNGKQQKKVEKRKFIANLTWLAGDPPVGVNQSHWNQNFEIVQFFEGWLRKSLQSSPGELQGSLLNVGYFPTTAKICAFQILFSNRL